MIRTVFTTIAATGLALSLMAQAVLTDAVLSDASLGGTTSGGEAYSPIGFSQVCETNYGATYTTEIKAVFTNAVVSGACLVAAVVITYPGGLPSAMSDSMTNTWTMATNTTWSGGVALTVCYYATNAHAGSTTVTCTPYQSSPYCQMIVSEYTNVANVNPVDVLDIASGTGGAAPATLTTPSVTASTTNGVAVGVFFASTGPLAAGSGYALDKYASVGLVEHKVMTTSGAITATCTNSTSSDAYVAGILVMKHQ